MDGGSRTSTYPLDDKTSRPTDPSIGDIRPDPEHPTYPTLAMLCPPKQPNDLLVILPRQLRFGIHREPRDDAAGLLRPDQLPFFESRLESVVVLLRHGRALLTELLLHVRIHAAGADGYRCDVWLLDSDVVGQRVQGGFGRAVRAPRGVRAGGRAGRDEHHPALGRPEVWDGFLCLVERQHMPCHSGTTNYPTYQRKCAEEVGIVKLFPFINRGVLDASHGREHTMVDHNAI